MTCCTSNSITYQNVIKMFFLLSWVEKTVRYNDPTHHRHSQHLLFEAAKTPAKPTFISFHQLSNLTEKLDKCQQQKTYLILHIIVIHNIYFLRQQWGGGASIYWQIYLNWPKEFSSVEQFDRKTWQMSATENLPDPTQHLHNIYFLKRQWGGSAPI